MFKRQGFLGSFNFKDFAKEKYYRKDIPNGEEFLELVHPKKYINKIKRACFNKAHLAELDLTPETYEIACLGVGTVILASDKGDFALQNIDGHHAGRETAMGFNLFNATAIAAQRLINQNKKVAIIDIDGHHGNGTQDIFYNTNKVLYCSIHQQRAFPAIAFDKIVIS